MNCANATGCLLTCLRVVLMFLATAFLELAGSRGILVAAEVRCIRRSYDASTLSTRSASTSCIRG